jgi:hypothetical protein
MTAPTEPRADLTPSQEAEIDRLFHAFGPTSPLARAISEGRARIAGYEPLREFADTGEGESA